MSRLKLPLNFYKRDTVVVAKELLGQKLVHILNGERIAGIITEVEAYLGAKDKACHTYNYRRTPRTETMYLNGGVSYIYFIYGMHYCFNVVTQSKGIPEAVLIRSIKPCEGIETMQKLRKQKALTNLTTGPGKLTQALGITKKQDGLRLNSKTLFIEKGFKLTVDQIVVTPRIGVHYAEDHALWPLRFYSKDQEYISKK